MKFNKWFLAIFLFVVAAVASVPALAQDCTVSNSNDVACQKQTQTQGSPSATINAPRAVVGQIAIPSHQAPQVFQVFPTNFGMPPEITGIGLEMFYNQICAPEESNDGESQVIKVDGASDLTKITITTHPSFKSLQKNWNLTAKVRMDLLGGKQKYRCLGILTAAASQKALKNDVPVGFSVIASDIRRIVRKEFTGISETIVVLSSSQYWAGGAGIVNSASAASLGILGAFTNLGITPGVMSGKGGAGPAAKSGITALILMPTTDEDPARVEIELAGIPSPVKLDGPVPIASDSAKKNETLK